MDDVLLKVNSKKIPLNIFVKKVFVNVLLGLCSSIRTDKNKKTIELKIKL